MVRIINPPPTPKSIVLFGRVCDCEPVSPKTTFRTVEEIGPEGPVGADRDEDRHDKMEVKGRRLTVNSRSAQCAIQSGGFSPKELIKMALGGK
jgi:hypothetical protein